MSFAVQIRSCSPPILKDSWLVRQHVQNRLLIPLPRQYLTDGSQMLLVHKHSSSRLQACCLLKENVLLIVASLVLLMMGCRPILFNCVHINFGLRPLVTPPRNKKLTGDMFLSNTTFFFLCTRQTETTYIYANDLVQQALAKLTKSTNTVCKAVVHSATNYKYVKTHLSHNQL